LRYNGLTRVGLLKPNQAFSSTCKPGDIQWELPREASSQDLTFSDSASTTYSSWLCYWLLIGAIIPEFTLPVNEKDLGWVGNSDLHLQILVFKYFMRVTPL
jgi:hypothetical protein